MTDHDVLETFNQRLQTYVDDHPGCQEAELKAYAAMLEVATPGLKDAIRRAALEDRITVAFTADRGDGLPAAGPTEAHDEDGEVFWKAIDQWTLADFRLNLAWWHRRPGAKSGFV
jgi:sarcosine oxidase gamma subunit